MKVARKETTVHTHTYTHTHTQLKCLYIIKVTVYYVNHVRTYVHLAALIDAALHKTALRPPLSLFFGII